MAMCCCCVCLCLRHLPIRFIIHLNTPNRTNCKTAAKTTIQTNMITIKNHIFFFFIQSFELKQVQFKNRTAIFLSFNNYWSFSAIVLSIVSRFFFLVWMEYWSVCDNKDCRFKCLCVLTRQFISRPKITWLLFIYLSDNFERNVCITTHLPKFRYEFNIRLFWESYLIATRALERAYFIGYSTTIEYKWNDFRINGNFISINWAPKFNISVYHIRISQKKKISGGVGVKIPNKVISNTNNNNNNQKL